MASLALSQTQPRLVVNNLWICFGDTPVLRGVSEEFGSNITAIMGNSGCGKTTLLRNLNRLDDKTPGYRTNASSRLRRRMNLEEIGEGSITVDGKDLYESPDIVILKDVGMIMQKSYALQPTILDEITFSPKALGMLKGASRRSIAEYALEHLKMAGLELKRHRLLDHLSSFSGGQQQRICIARALALKPKILLCDEPTTGLDPTSTNYVEETLRHLNEEEKIPIIIVTHFKHQAHSLADKVLFMDEGQIVEKGKTDDVILRPQHPAAQQYMRTVAQEVAAP